MDESILTSVKNFLGIAEEYKAFDDKLIPIINTVFPILRQLGVGPDRPFYVEDCTTSWREFSDEISNLLMVKTYVGLKVKKLFDPAQNGTLAEAENNSIAELEWRLNVEAELGE